MLDKDVRPVLVPEKKLVHRFAVRVMLPLLLPINSNRNLRGDRPPVEVEEGEEVDEVVVVEGVGGVGEEEVGVVEVVEEEEEDKEGEGDA